MKNQFENSGAGSHPLARKVINSRVFRNVKSFAQLERKISKIKNTKVKGAAWEIFRKFYMTQVRGIKEFYYCHQIPLEFKNKLRIPDGDKGIDCVYIDVDDSLVVGQDKFRSKSFQRNSTPDHVFLSKKPLVFTICSKILSIFRIINVR